MHRYNHSAHVYNAQYSEEQEAKIKTIMQNLRLQPKSNALDVGCGTGLLIKQLVDRAEFIVGTDISRGLLQEARKKAQFHQHVSLVLADADNMPFPEQIFDAVFAVTLLQNVPDPAVTLNEIKRVSKQTASIAATGLKKRFAQEDFVEMLKRADLRVDTVELDEKNREYVCVCRKVRR